MTIQEIKISLDSKKLSTNRERLKLFYYLVKYGEISKDDFLEIATNYFKIL